MLRAVPRIIATAFSRECALRSGSFVFAISITWEEVIFPTFSLFGMPEPLITPAAFLINSDAGGVFVMKLNDLSAYTVRTTGMMVSPNACVWALKALQNSMIFTPWGPRAGPTGGAGFAFPAGIWSFT